MKRFFTLLALLCCMQAHAATVPFTFSNRAGSLPLSELDANFSALQGTASPSTQGSSLIGHKRPETGALGQDLRSYLDAYSINVKAVGAVCNDSTDDSTVIQTLINYLSTIGGGTAVLPRATCKVSQLNIPQNVALVGEASSSAYDDTGLSAQSMLHCTSGDWCVALTGRSSTLRNVRIDGQGGTVAYGLVVATIKTVVEDVTVSYFEYGVTGANMNSNIFRNLTSFANSKIGISVMNANVGGVGAYEYPKIAALIGVIGSTTYTFENCTVRTNQIGIVVRESMNAVFRGCVVESNYKHAYMQFKQAGGNSDAVLLEDMHFENNSRDATPWVLTGIEHLKSSVSTYLVGNISGAYDGATESGYDYWLGSAEETADLVNTIGGPVSYNEVRHSYLQCGKACVRLRSSRYMQINDSYLLSQIGATLVSLDSSKALRTTFKNPHAYALSSVGVFGYAAGGYATSVYLDHQPLTITYTGVPSGTWKDLVTVTGLDWGNKYEYAASLSTASLFATYGAQGYVFFTGSGSTAQIIPYITGGTIASLTSGGAEVRINSGVLQYRQLSGGNADIYAIIRNRGPILNY